MCIRDRKEALNNINLSIEIGKIIGLLGPNGSGKTTLIKLINGLLTPNEGEITVDGNRIGNESRLAVSYLPDKTYLPDWMKVSDIFKMFTDFYGNFEIEKARDMLGRLNISEGERLKALSKGNKEKVQLILVMSRNAKLYLLDEPIGCLLYTSKVSEYFFCYKRHKRMKKLKRIYKNCFKSP